VTRYDGGSIYQASSTAIARAVLGAIDTRYRAEGGPQGRFGYPTARGSHAGGILQLFEHGNLAQARGGPVVEVRDDVLAAARPASGVDHPGLPVEDERTRRRAPASNASSTGSCPDHRGGLVAVGRDLATRYLDVEGGPARWGRPPPPRRGRRGPRPRAPPRRARSTRAPRPAPGCSTATSSTPTSAAADPAVARPADQRRGRHAGRTAASVVRARRHRRSSPTAASASSPRAGPARPGDLARTTPDGGVGRTPRSPRDLAP
jgi:hypothetical protein